MIHEELSGEIIGAAMEVLNELKPGLDDPATAGLRTRNDHRTEPPRTQCFSPKPVPSFLSRRINWQPHPRSDRRRCCDRRSQSGLSPRRVAQMIGYLNITSLDLAMLINFKNARLEWKRVLRPQEPDPAAAGPNPDLHA